MQISKSMLNSPKQLLFVIILFSSKFRYISSFPYFKRIKSSLKCTNALYYKSMIISEKKRIQNIMLNCSKHQTICTNFFFYILYFLVDLHKFYICKILAHKIVYKMHKCTFNKSR